MSGLFEKLSTQLHGILNDAADNMEDPGRTARQLGRDLDTAIGQADEQMVEVKAEYNLITSHRDGAKAEVDKYVAWATKAVAQNNDELAKEALAEKAKHVTELNGFQAQLDSFAPNLQRLEDQIQKLRDKKDDMARKTDLLEARSATADASDKMATIIGGIGSSSSAADSFDHLEDKVAKKEAEASARVQMAADKNGDALKDKFAALDSPASSVDNELAALKASMQGKKD